MDRALRLLLSNRNQQQCSVQISNIIKQKLQLLQDVSQFHVQIKINVQYIFFVDVGGIAKPNYLIFTESTNNKQTKCISATHISFFLALDCKSVNPLIDRGSKNLGYEALSFKFQLHDRSERQTTTAYIDQLICILNIYNLVKYTFAIQVQVQ